MTAIDLKYGNVEADFAEFKQNEPVFILRAQDTAAVMLLRDYHTLCRDLGSPQGHLDSVSENIRVFSDWQTKNDIKIPD